MNMGRQGFLFLIIGALQLVLDWLAFVTLTASGLPVVPANVISRISAALAGFWLNGRLTFAGPEGPRLGGVRLFRFALLWLAMTGLSTVLIAWTADAFDLRHAWLAKPGMEAVLAGLSFILQRHWVYRKS